MARRASSATRAHGSASGSASGSAPDVARALQTASAQMDRLRAELLSSLTSVVSDTVDLAFEQHEEAFVQATQAVHRFHGSATASECGRPARGNAPSDGAMVNEYDQFHRCCQRLVGYIDANMATSPDFKQQMDRVILACHSNASETVLRSVVTRRLWFHTKDSANGSDDDDDDELRPIKTEDDEHTGEEEMVRVRTKPSRGGTTVARATPPRRGPKKRVAAPPPPPPPTRRATVKSPVKKRARRESVTRRPRDATSDEDSDDVEEPGEEDGVRRKRKRRTPRVHKSEEEDDDDEERRAEAANSDATSQPHYGEADELLPFKDAIGDMCYADGRTPAQTRFFKERLRKAIQFVDAQLCKPPKGKSCIWECAKIRRQMCNQNLRCRNKICRLWHDVEAHTDRCQNSHCEFRIRVMLRETLYKIDHKKMELQGFRNELASKKKALQYLKNESLPDREKVAGKRMLDNEIDQLESEIEHAEKDLGVFKATKKTYWATLNEIGITIDDDANDQFPEFKAHYADKKAIKKEKPTKAPNRSVLGYTPPKPAEPSRSERFRRRQSIDAAHSTPSPVKQRERISRRSTQQSLKVLSNGVIDLDGESDEQADENEEAKTDRSAEDDDPRTTNGTSAIASGSDVVHSGAAEPHHHQVSTSDGEDHGGTEKTLEPESIEEEEPIREEVGQADSVQAQPKDGESQADDMQYADYTIESEENQRDANPPTTPESARLDASNQ